MFKSFDTKYVTKFQQKGVQKGKTVHILKFKNASEVQTGSHTLVNTWHRCICKQIWDNTSEKEYCICKENVLWEQIEKSKKITMKHA